MMLHTLILAWNRLRPFEGTALLKIVSLIVSLIFVILMVFSITQGHAAPPQITAWSSANTLPHHPNPERSRTVQREQDRSSGTGGAMPVGLYGLITCSM